MPFMSQKFKHDGQNKKKPPPRPPPPNFSKLKSKSTLSIPQEIDDLIEWSPTSSPKVERSHHLRGSVSSSFSSSTSSLASSKKSFECDNTMTNNLWPMNLNIKTTPSNSTFFIPSNKPKNCDSKAEIPSLFNPTIIRAERSKSVPKSNSIFDSPSPDQPSPPSPPMPSVPPPSPPKERENEDISNIAYGIALFDYEGKDPSDLSFQKEDIVVLLRRVNEDWYYGRVLEKEGMFPANFIDIQVPLKEIDNNTVMALYEFKPQMPGDLPLKPGQLIKVINKIDDNWLYGMSGNATGQFPSNFVDRIPIL